MKHILLLFEYPTMFGGERSLLTMLQAAKQNDFTFSASAPHSGDLFSALTALGIEVHPMPVELRTPSKLPLQAYRSELATLLRSVKPDLVHANSLHMARKAGPVLKQTNIVGIGHLRDIMKLRRQAIEDLNCHARLLAVSHATRDFHLQQGLLPEKIATLYNGVDLQTFSRTAPASRLHEELQLPTGAKLIATIGQISIRKGMDILLAAAPQIASKCPLAHFLILGKCNSRKQETLQYEAALHEAAAQGPLGGRVHFLGFRSDVAALMPEFDCLAHAALQEPLGRVLLEAAATEIPVVATDVGGTREIFSLSEATQSSARYAATLVPPKDPQALAEGLLAVMENRSAAAEKARQARTIMESCFDLHKQAEQLMQHYREVLGM